MKINITTNPEAIKAYASTSSTKIHQAQGTSTDGSPGLSSLRDKVEISEKVKLFHDIRDAALSAPDIRSEKVHELGETIAKGIYRPDMTVIADKLLSPDISSRI